MKSRIIILSMLCWLATLAVIPSAAQTRPTLYLSDNLVGNSTAVGNHKTFTYDAARDLYYYSVPGYTVTTSSLQTGDFSISTSATDTYSWRENILYNENNYTEQDNSVNPKVTTKIGGNINPDGITHYSLKHGGDRQLGRWMTVAQYNYAFGYTIYVNGDLDDMWVVKNLYISDNIIGNTSISNNDVSGSNSWCFDYDSNTNEYFIEIPAGTVTGNVTRGDFQLSTKAGTYANWKTGLYYASASGYSPAGANPTQFMDPNTPYNLTAASPTNTLSHWMTVANYDKNRTYTFYVSGDLSSLRYKVEQKVYIQGGFNGIGYSRFEPFEYDADKDVYSYTANSSLSQTFGIFKIARADDASQRLSCSNYTSSLSLSPNEIYAVSTGTGGEQKISVPTGATRVTIYIKGDLSHMWIETEGGESAPAYYIADVNSATAINPDSFTKNDDGSYTYALPPLNNSVIQVRLSTMRSGSRDNDSYGFDGNRVTAWGLTLNGPEVALVSYDGYLTIPAGYSRVLHISADGKVSVTGTTDHPVVYMDDLALGLDHKCDIVNAKKMTYDPVNHYYKLEVDYTVGLGADFQFSLTPPNPSGTFDTDYVAWRKGLIWLTGAVAGSYNNEIIADGRHYPASYSPTLNNSGKYWMTIKDYDKTDGYRKGYTFYLAEDFSEFWVEPEYEDLYLSDHMAGISPSGSTDNGVNRKFKFDHDTQQYYYEAAASTQIGADFQVSRTTGNYTNWKSGLIYVTDHDYTSDSQAKTKNIALNTWYDLTVCPMGNTDGHWMTVDGWVSGAKDYTIYIDKGMTKLMVKARRTNIGNMYIIGHLTNNLEGAYLYTGDNYSIRQMEYDEEFDAFKFTMAGARWSVFELSEQAPPCSYADWVNGMYAFMPTYDSDCSDFFGNHHTGEPVIQPVLKTNPFNMDKDDPNYIKYPADKGHYYPDGDSRKQAGMRDMSIEGFNPDWLYTVYISGDKKNIWVTEQPINMPLKAADFIDQTDFNNPKPIPHYFVVGTRTADWRLLPEWEFKPGADATDMFISGRFMYDGYFAIAKVDNYLDYIHHRYQVFSNDSEDQDYKIWDSNKQLIESDGDHNYPLHSISLFPKGNSHALHYDDGDYINGQPIHDIHNSITWDIGVGATASEGGKVNSDMMRYALPFRFSRLTLELDGDGNPVMLTPVGSYNRKIINKYRTFVLMGTDINYENEFDFQNCLGVRDIRKMTPAFQATDTHELNWANSWIAWDSARTPYYDAFQNTLFVTAYDKDWQNNSLTLLDTPENVNGTTVWTEYSSDHLVFEMADPDSDPEYGWVYKNHPFKDGQGSDYIGYKPNEGESKGTWNNETYSWDSEPGVGEYTIAKDYDSESGYRYQERFANYDLNDSDLKHHGNKLGDNGKPQAATSTKSATDGWVCYVLKNVSLKGDFIVTSGWGGNIASAEGYDILPNDPNVPRNNLRLYFGNFSPRRSKKVGNSYTGGQVSYDSDTWSYTVRGFDLKTQATEDDASDNIKLLYRTYRDIDETNFSTQGTHFEPVTHADRTETYTNPAKMQNFDRIILWYNTNVDRTTPEIPNGAIQFVQESITPNARAYRKAGSNNQFYVNWNIVDNTVDNPANSDYKDWEVLSYKVTRYRYVTVTNADNEEERQAQVYREFDTVEPRDMTVIDALTGRITFNDEYMLPPGTYFYTVEVTIVNPIDSRDVRSRTATTNSVTVAEPAKTAVIDTEQIIEKADDNSDLYSFNVRSTIRLTNSTTTLNSESSHLKYVWQDMDYVDVYADPDTYNRLAKATSVEITNIGKMQIWNTDGTGLAQDPDGSVDPDILKVADELLPFSDTLTRSHATDSNAPSSYIGWGLDENYKNAVTGEPEFKYDSSVGKYKIRFKLQPYYWSTQTRVWNNAQNKYVYSTADDYWNYFGTLWRLQQIELPTIVWHNVEPSENLLGGDAPQYKIEAYVGPKTGAVNLYEGNKLVVVPLEDYWRKNLEFEPDDSSTGVYLPIATYTFEPYIGKSDQQADYTGFDRTDANHIASQPVGAHGNTGAGYHAQAPVQYTELNEIGARVHTFIPVTQEVLENTNIGYVSMTVNNPTARAEQSFPYIRPDKFKETADGPYTSDINATLHNLPLIGSGSTRNTGLPVGNDSPGTYAHYDMPYDDISYRFSAIPIYQNAGWITSNESGLAPSYKIPASYRIVTKALPIGNFSELEFKSVKHIFTAYIDEFLKQRDHTRPFGMRFFGAISVDEEKRGALDNVNAYYGFNVQSDNRITGTDALGNHVQGGCPLHLETSEQGYADNWQGLFNPQYFSPANAYDSSMDFAVGQIPGYYKYTGGAYSDDSHNWSRLAAKANYLAFAFGPMRVSFDPEWVSWSGYSLEVTPYVTLPFVPASVTIPDPAADPETNPDATTTVSYSYWTIGAVGTPGLNAPAKTAPSTAVPHNHIIPMTIQTPSINYWKEDLTTGIENIENDDADAVYYNTQGIRVDEPQHGELYIVKRNGVVTRELYLK